MSGVLGRSGTGPHRSKTWTDEKCERLRELWAARPQMSAATIGRELGFDSRCAVIGKARRMKLPPHRDVVGTPGSRRARQPTAKPADGHTHTQPRHWAALPECETTAANDLPPDRSDCAVTIVGLTDATCRWPLGDPSALMTYCGAESFPGLPYCARHCRVAYTTADGLKLARAG